jgi:hypothetical protein
MMGDVGRWRMGARLYEAALRERGDWGSGGLVGVGVVVECRMRDAV